MVQKEGMKRLVILLSLFGCLTLVSSAQPYYPIKVQQRWGLINGNGEIVQEPRYDAIGEFKKYGYAVMQRNGRVGLLNKYGREIIQPNYDDLKVLDSSLFAVLDEGAWMVINLQERTILPKGYEKVTVWEGQYIAFLQNDLWGVVDAAGNALIPPQYEAIRFEKDYFLLYKNEKTGLALLNGNRILEPIAEEIHPYSAQLFFFRQDGRWGAVNENGQPVIENRYTAYEPISSSFIKLYYDGLPLLFSIPCQRLIGQQAYDDFFPLTSRLVLAKKNRQLGLLDWCGNTVLSAAYQEIQQYRGALYRVKNNGRWAICKGGDELLTDFRYDYIAPLRENTGIVKKDGLYGIVNMEGEEIVAPTYHRIEMLQGSARAYQQNGDNAGESLVVLRFDRQGRLVANESYQNHFQLRTAARTTAEGPLNRDESGYVLKDFEWFYSSQADRWGLRRTADGEIQIPPSFSYLRVDQQLGLTLVGMNSPANYEFERTTFRFEMRYGLVNNELGALVTDLQFWDVHFEDFHAGGSLARVFLANGRYGLIDKRGKLVEDNYAYIGPFQDGVAAMSRAGRLSGSMKPDFAIGRLGDFLDKVLSPVTMTDYTQYDKLFQVGASLVCTDCRWGYMGENGRVLVEEQYDFAEPFTNEVGIVARENKWGAVNRQGRQIIPLRYDQVHFLENTNNRIIRVYVERPKYGLIDTLGQLAVNAIYDEIGAFREDRLSVKYNNLWGYANKDGLEVVSCRFQEVKEFHEGIAAVRLGRKWGFIDKLGNEQLGFRYEDAGNFSEGLCWVKTSSGTGYINTNGDFLMPPAFEEAHDFFNGVARVRQDGQYGLIDLKGDFIQKPTFFHIYPFNEHGLAIVRFGRDGDRYGIIDTNGRLLTRRTYQEIQPFSEGLAVVKDRGSYGFIDTLGKEVVALEYSNLSSFSEGRAAAYKDGHCGYINRLGKEMNAFEFSRCQDYDGGRAIVYKGLRRAGLLNLEGELILEPSINRLLEFSEGRGLVRDSKFRFYYITEEAMLYNGFYQKASSFNHGVAVVQVNDKWGIINRKGIELIPPKYSKIESFENGYAKVKVEGFNGLSDLNGDFIVQPDYEFISYAGEGIFRAEQGDKVGYFDASGDWVWDLSN